MKSLSRLLSPERILWLDAESKNECLRTLVETLTRTSEIDNADDVLHAILEREKLLSAGSVSYTHLTLPTLYSV